ncbi:hypothetical protein RhiirA4_480981 [Rhizophagus irregularis]|uniref:Uncharacterized protein n=1 Tax=Rhizophagus irregularis TaxID=588596 RepID=A0A2I1HIS8_9GLOM|nr:hypothetical protein RhiirA4_480981 [Rhizophagus irregularis]
MVPCYRWNEIRSRNWTLKMPAWSRNWTLRRIPAWNKPDFKLLVLQGLQMHGLDGVSSALGLGLVLQLGLGYADMASCSFCVELWMLGQYLAVDWRLGMNWYRSLRFLGQLLSFYSVHPTCNTIRGSRIGYMGFRRSKTRLDWSKMPI